jgi:hypothetical protein
MNVIDLSSSFPEGDRSALISLSSPFFFRHPAKPLHAFVILMLSPG